MERKALLLGATGLVGGQCLRRLLTCGAYSEVRVLTRRALGIEHPRLRETLFDDTGLEPHRDCFRVDDVFCCLGTTLRQAGSRAAFRRVDQDLVVRAGELAAAAGARRFIVVSAINARVHSPFFYARVKGRTEQQLERAGLPLLAFMQPSLLLGPREQRRPAEELGGRLFRAVAPLAAWSGAGWLPVSAERLAEAMLGMALAGPSKGTYRLRYRDFEVFARTFRERYPDAAAPEQALKGPRTHKERG